MGWVKTVDEYYSGSNPAGQHASVRNILDSVMEELPKNKSRKFCYAEMGFFKRWYNSQNNETKASVRELIKNKQLEIVNGGWVSHDEATPDYNMILDNMMIGHEWLASEFGVTPTVGWNIDDFGHSDTNARLYAEMGIDSMFFSRMDHQEKHERSLPGAKAMNFVWRPGNDHFPGQYQVLTNVFKTDYCFPTEFYSAENYDSDEIMVMDPSLSTFNAKQKMMELVNFV